MGVTITKSGFTIHNGKDEILAYREHFEQALSEMKRIDAAQCIRRVSDEALCATKIIGRRPPGRPFEMRRMS